MSAGVLPVFSGVFCAARFLDRGVFVDSSGISRYYFSIMDASEIISIDIQFLSNAYNTGGGGDVFSLCLCRCVMCASSLLSAEICPLESGVTFFWREGAGEAVRSSVGRLSCAAQFRFAKLLLFFKIHLLSRRCLPQPAVASQIIDLLTEFCACKTRRRRTICFRLTNQFSLRLSLQTSCLFQHDLGLRPKNLRSFFLFFLFCQFFVLGLLAGILGVLRECPGCVFAQSVKKKCCSS